MTKLEPKLRFKEFSGEWEEKTLIDISNFVNEKIQLNKITLNTYISTENILPNFQGTIKASKLPNIKNITKFKKNDILISNIRPYLKKIWLANINGGASNDIIIIRVKEDNNPNYLLYIVENDKFINYVMKGAKGVKMPRGDLSLIKKYPLLVPLPKEQQKIASTLSSLDNLIEAYKQKVEALQKHKKGLMQQLFPADGEKVPKLRFKEFSGEWEEKKLGDIGKVSMCKRILKSQTSENEEIPFYKIGTFGKTPDTYIKREVFEEYKQKYSYPKKGDILISASGTIGRTVVFDGKEAYFQDSNIVWIANDEKIMTNDFLKFYYEIIKWVTDDNTISRLYNENLRNIKILIPSYKDKEKKEQQKIASTLSSLDNLIEAQKQKVEALQKHKKGLMQQMFVSNDDIKKGQS